MYLQKLRPQLILKLWIRVLNYSESIGNFIKYDFPQYLQKTKIARDKKP